MKGVSQYAESADGSRSGEQSTIILAFRLSPGRRDTKGDEMAGGRSDFHSGNDGQVGRILGQIAIGHGHVVIRDGDEGQVGFFGRRHDLRHRAAAVGGLGVDMDHAHSLGGTFAFRGDRKLDDQTFRQNGEDQRG